MKRTASEQLPTFENAQFWYGPEMARRSDWIYELSPSDIEEIDRAVAAVDGKDLLKLRRADFPLGELAARLTSLRHDLLHGRGFFLMRGIPVRRYTRKQAVIAFLGIGLHFGEPLSQNGKGHLLGHVKNLGRDISDPEARGYQTDGRLEYHTDYTDVVALLCLNASKEGGASSIVSTTTVWNEMVKRRPDLARSLMTEPFYSSRFAEVPDGERRFYKIPVFTPWNDRMIAFVMSRRPIINAQAFPEVPRVSEIQLEALSLLESIMHEAGIYLDMAFRPGDMQFLCNQFIAHSRTRYVDWPELERRRHLLRLWLACEDGPEIPAAITDNFLGTTSSGRPDGINFPGVPLKIPLEAE